MKKLLLLLFLSFTLLSLYAQNPEWIIYNTNNSGLPNNEVNALAIDGIGNKWVGAGFTGFGPGGLAKFDGTN